MVKVDAEESLDTVDALFAEETEATVVEEDEVLAELDDVKDSTESAPKTAGVAKDPEEVDATLTQDPAE